MKFRGKLRDHRVKMDDDDYKQINIFIQPQKTSEEIDIKVRL